MPENSVYQNRSVKWIEKLGLFVESRLAQNWITALIVLNAVTLGLETEEDLIQGYEKILSQIDSLILAIFSLEFLSNSYTDDYLFLKMAGIYLTS